MESNNLCWQPGTMSQKACEFAIDAAFGAESIECLVDNEWSSKGVALSSYLEIDSNRRKDGGKD